MSLLTLMVKANTFQRCCDIVFYSESFSPPRKSFFRPKQADIFIKWALILAINKPSGLRQVVREETLCLLFPVKAGLF